AGLLCLGAMRNWRATAAAILGLTAVAYWLGQAPGAGEEPHSRAEKAHGVGAVPFRLVQPNIGQDEKYDPEEAERNTRIYAQLSGSPGNAGRVLLWPEGATLRFLDIEADARRELAALLGPHDLLITGGPSVDLDLHGNDDVYHNSVFA